MLNNHQWGLRMRAIAQKPLQISFLDMNVRINHLRPQSYLPEADEINLTPNYCHRKSMANGKIEWYAEIYGRNISNGPIRMVMAAKKACWTSTNSGRVCLCTKVQNTELSLDNKVRGANMGPTWVLSAPDGPHVGHINFDISVSTSPWCQHNTSNISSSFIHVLVWWLSIRIYIYICIYIYTLYIHSWQKRLLHPHWRQ